MQVYLRHYLILRLWPDCTLEPCEYCTSPDRSSGLLTGQSDTCTPATCCRTFGLSLLIWWKHSEDFTLVPSSYFLRSSSANLNPRGVALHPKSEGNVLVRVLGSNTTAWRRPQLKHRMFVWSHISVHQCAARNVWIHSLALPLVHFYSDLFIIGKHFRPNMNKTQM